MNTEKHTAVDVHKMDQETIERIIRKYEEEGYELSAISKFPPPHIWYHFAPKSNNG